MNDNNFQKLFDTLLPVHPSPTLLPRVLENFNTYSLRKVRWYFTFHLSLLALSIIAFVPALGYCLKELGSSGFYEYSSLILSDGGVVLTYWKDLLIILLESLPVLGVVAVFSTVLLFLIALRKSVTDLSILFGNRMQTMI